MPLAFNLAYGEPHPLASGAAPAETPAWRNAQGDGRGAYAVALLGDTHFDAEPESVYHSHYAETHRWRAKAQHEEFRRNGEMWAPGGRLRSLLAASAALAAADPATRFVLQLGDLVQGDCWDDADHRRMLDDGLAALRGPFPAGLPFLSVLGNHDYRGAPSARNITLPWFNDLLSREIGAPAAFPVISFRVDDDRWIFCDFETADLLALAREIESDPGARYVFLVTHGPFTAYDSPNWRWRLSGWKKRGGSGVGATELFEAVSRRRAIVLSGHTHKTAFYRNENPFGGYTELTVNSVWEADDLATAKPVNDSPAQYGLRRRHKIPAEDLEEFDADIARFKAGLTEYYLGLGAGHYRLEVSDDRVLARFYPGAATEPARTFDLTPGKAAPAPSVAPVAPAAAAGAALPAAAFPHVTGDAFGTPVPISDGSPGPGRGLWLEDGRLYILSSNELCLYSVEDDPLRPRLLGRAPGVLEGRQVVASGGIAYVSARERGMWIVDCRVPDRMEVLCRYDSIGLGTGVEVSGDVCMLTETRHGVEFIDVSDPRRPQHIRICKTDESQSVIYRDGYVYSGEWLLAHLTVLDARDMSAVREVARCDFHGNGDGIWKCGNFLYCATGRHAAHVPGIKPENRMGQGLDIIDVSDPARPRNVSRISYAPGFCRGKPDTWTPRVSGSLLVSAQTCQGLYAVDVSDPANPKILDRWIAPDMHPIAGVSGTEDCPGGAVTSVAIGDGVVYAAGPDFVPVAIPCRMAKYEPVHRGKPPANAGWRDPYPDPPADFARWRPPPQFRGLARACAVVGDTCYAACSDAGLYALDLCETGIAGAKKLGPEKAFDVAARGDRLYVAEGSQGWAIYSITGDGIVEIGRYRRDGETARDVYACTERWAVFSNRERCHLMDVSDPSAPKYVLSAQNQAGWNKFMCPDLLGGRYLACNSALKYVEWIDLDAVPAPKLSIAADSLLSSSAGLCGLGENALVCDKGRYAIVRPGADGPWNFREFDGGGISRTDGRLVAQSLQNGGTIRLHDFSDPLCPKRLGEWSMKSSFAGPCSFWKGRIIVPCGYMGVLLQKAASTNPQF